MVTDEMVEKAALHLIVPAGDMLSKEDIRAALEAVEPDFWAQAFDKYGDAVLGKAEPEGPAP